MGFPEHIDRGVSTKTTTHEHVDRDSELAIGCRLLRSARPDGPN
jgi:hypothetical protein